MLRDQISATRIVINSSLIRDWKLPSLLVCIRDCHPRLARATNWNCSPGSPLPLRGSSSSPNFKRYCGRKKSVVAIFAPIALFAVSSPALHCNAPHSLHRPFNESSTFPYTTTTTTIRPFLCALYLDVFPGLFRRAFTRARASYRSQCMYRIRGLIQVQDSE